MKKIIEFMPLFQHTCDHILCLEECQEGEECLVKDISIFLQNRQREDIFIVETNKDNVDGDACVMVNP